MSWLGSEEYIAKGGNIVIGGGTGKIGFDESSYGFSGREFPARNFSTTDESTMIICWFALLLRRV